ncbi:MAG TPA: TatD family hydrolase [Candidatus Atribacteria bacterium]|nr:TatD family hydrolase [Candidatus Atribacteria bacterium]
MIIDTHLHYGKKVMFDLDFSLLISLMEAHGIDKGLISSIECCEYRPDADELLEDQKPQIEANKELLEKIKGCGKDLYISFWCKPATEGNIDEVYSFIRENRHYVRGLKLHPFYSRLPLEDARYDPYIDIAEALDLPVSVHTANDSLSGPGQLLAMAKRFPRVNFIMVHMGLCSDNEEAIECLGQADNLIGDTTWVHFDKVLKAVEICGPEKMIFGTDAPIDGARSYAFYEQLLRAYQDDPAKWEHVMYKNAARLFGI